MDYPASTNDVTTSRYYVRYAYPVGKYPELEEQLWLSVVRIVPPAPRFVLQILHGIDEHKERYLPLMQYVARAGGIVICHDRRGHGESVFSEGLGYPGSHPENFTLSDIDAVYASAFQPVPEDGLCVIHAEDYPLLDPLPRYLLGFSMGALEAAAYLGTNDDGLAGCFLCGMPHREPFVRAAQIWVSLLSLFPGETARPFFMNRYAMQRYNAAFRKNIRTDAPTDAAENASYLWLSENPENRRQFAADPLCGADMTVAAFRYLLLLVHDAYVSASYDLRQREIPLWFFSGENDPVAGGIHRTTDTVRFFSDIGYTTPENRLFPHMRHEIFEDNDCERAFQAVTDAILSVNDKAADILSERHRAAAAEYTTQRIETDKRT